MAKVCNVWLKYIHPTCCNYTDAECMISRNALARNRRQNVGEKQKIECGRETEDRMWARNRRQNVGEKQKTECGRETEDRMWARNRSQNVGEKQKIECGRETEDRMWARNRR